MGLVGYVLEYMLNYILNYIIIDLVKKTIYLPSFFALALTNKELRKSYLQPIKKLPNWRKKQEKN